MRKNDRALVSLFSYSESYARAIKAEACLANFALRTGVGKIDISTT
jgi:hypothetical protein